MSKEAALRAMREARYNERLRTAATPASASTPTRAKAAGRPAAKVADVDAAVPAAPAVEADGLCGHRSMNGRTCTREHGHAAKSHRYA